MQTSLSSILKKSSLSLAVVLGALSASTASAADKGFYGALNASIGQTDEESFDYAAGANIESEFEDGYGGSAAVGYNFGKITPLGNIRTEVEAGYRTADIESHSLNGGAPLAGPTGKGEVTYGLLNVYQDLNFGTSKLVPYIGAGVGYANVKYKNFGVAAIPDVLDDSYNAFAYQAIIGTAYEITPALALTVDYRYFATEDKDVTTAIGNTTSIGYTSNNITAGLRYNF